METYTLKEGEGKIWGISNELAQVGKTLSIYDGDVLRFTIPLDKDFPEPTEGVPGMILNIHIITSLRVETDGGGLQFYWW